jgi:hypothetical protein
MVPFWVCSIDVRTRNGLLSVRKNNLDVAVLLSPLIPPDIEVV